MSELKKAQATAYAIWLKSFRILRQSLPRPLLLRLALFRSPLRSISFVDRTIKLLGGGVHILQVAKRPRREHFALCCLQESPRQHFLLHYPYHKSLRWGFLILILHPPAENRRL